MLLTQSDKEPVRPRTVSFTPSELPVFIEMFTLLPLLLPPDTRTCGDLYSRVCSDLLVSSLQTRLDTSHCTATNLHSSALLTHRHPLKTKVPGDLCRIFVHRIFFLNKICISYLHIILKFRSNERLFPEPYVQELFKNITVHCFLAVTLNTAKTWESPGWGNTTYPHMHACCSIIIILLKATCSHCMLVLKTPLLTFRFLFLPLVTHTINDSFHCSCIKYWQTSPEDKLDPKARYPPIS